MMSLALGVWVQLGVCPQLVHLRSVTRELCADHPRAARAVSTVSASMATASELQGGIDTRMTHA
jgi:hypothetical protein